MITIRHAPSQELKRCKREQSFEIAINYKLIKISNMRIVEMSKDVNKKNNKFKLSYENLQHK